MKSSLVQRHAGEPAPKYETQVLAGRRLLAWLSHFQCGYACLKDMWLGFGAGHPPPPSAWRGKVWHSKMQDGTAQHSTAQHV